MFPVASIKITVRLIVIRTTPPARKARKEQKTVRQSIEETLFSVRRKQERFCVCLTEKKNVVLLRLYTTNAFFYIGLVRDFD